MIECKDRDASCSKWVNENECIKNPSWMLFNCCQSCHNGKYGNTLFGKQTYLD